MKKKIICVFLVLILLISFSCMLTACDKGDDTKCFSSDVNVPKDEGNYNPLLESKGLNYIYDRYLDGYSIFKYSGIEKDVVIPYKHKGKDVVGIEAKAFNGNESIRSIFLPSSIKFIGYEAFGYCKNLERVYCDDFSFFYNLDFEGSYDSIFSNAIKEIYEGDVLLKDIKLPKDFKNASKYNLYNFPKRETITIDKANEHYYVDNNCLISKDKKELLVAGDGVSYIREGITKISYGAFNKVDIPVSLILPSTVKQIDLRNFEQKTDRIVVPNTIEDIYFGDCYCYFYGTEEEVLAGIKENYYYNPSKMVYYSENKPTDTKHRYWHFINDIATLWNA